MAEYLVVTTRATDSFPAEDFASLLPEERCRARSLYESRRFRSIWSRADGRGVVILVEADSEAVVQEALSSQVLEPFALALVEPHAPGHEGEARGHPLEMRTLATLNISSLPAARTFDDAQRLHKSLALAGLRLGQPVRSVRTADGAWGGTIRIGPSMPQFVAWSRLDGAALEATLAAEMAGIADALVSHRVEEAA